MVESYSCIAAFYNPGNIRSEHTEAPRGDSRSTQIHQVLTISSHSYCLRLLQDEVMVDGMSRRPND